MQTPLQHALLKHDRQVPRYTSYPAAPVFTREFGPNIHGEWIGQIPNHARLSLYIHVPFCAKLCWFCGCNTKITQRYNPIETYLPLLMAEISQMAERLAGKNVSVSHLHFGGGSPTIFSPVDFDRLMRHIRSHFNIEADAEIAIEVDPRHADPERLQVYAGQGVNRLSMGVQDFDQKVMQAVNRPQSYDLCAEVIANARRYGINGINIDLIYGLPYQTIDTIAQTTDLTVTLNPDRVAVFGYAHVPWMNKHMRLIPAETLPDTNLRVQLFDVVSARLEYAGYKAIGIDHFARPDSDMAIAHAQGTLHRNFQGYTTDTSEYLIGFGTSAISRFPQGYAQNAVSTAVYRDRLNAGESIIEKICTLAERDQVRARVIERIMCMMPCNPDQIALEFGFKDVDFSDAYLAMTPLCDDGLVTVSADGTIMPQIRQAARLVAACFDEYLPADTKGRHVTAA